MSEMNAPHPLFDRSDAPLIKGVALACAVAALTLGATASAAWAEEQSAGSETISADIAQIAKASRNAPEFKDIPKVPGDIRPARAWGAAAAEVETLGAQVAQATGPETWTLTATDAFADKALAEMSTAAAPVESTTPATEAFAKQIRARATPPPSPKR